MKIVEEFNSLQGEGKYLGVPSFFVRTTVCNLRCAWKNNDYTITICDSAYTSWNPEKGKDVDGKHIYDKVKGTQTKHVVITGGEPTLQPDLADVVTYLVENGLSVTIETNGTKYVKLPKNTFISISPKTSNSYAQEKGSIEEKMHKKNNVFIDAIRQWIENNDYQLKFVYNSLSDIKEIEYIQTELNVPNNKIYLMPQGINVLQFKDKQKELFDLCINKGWTYTPRLHIEIFGNIRGI